MHRPRTIGRRLCAVIGLSLTIALIAPHTAFAYSSTELTEAKILNHWDRIPRGLSGLAIQDFLSKRAHQHSVDMMSAGRLYHSNLAAVPGTWRTIGENVGVGPSLAVLNTAFMASKDHRANILCRCFRWVGTGVVRDSLGRYWVTQLFWG